MNYFIRILTIMVRENSNSFLSKLFIGVWCNGSTTGFGSVCRGSSPLIPASYPEYLNIILSP